MNKNHVDSLGESCWCDVVDYSSLLDVVGLPPETHTLNIPQLHSENCGVAEDVSLSVTSSQGSGIAERKRPNKRGRSDPYFLPGTKAGRERLRREKLNDRFLELSAVLEPGKPMKTEKLAILGDAIRVLNQLKAESQKYEEMNRRLSEEIINLKAEKNELRQEKLKLKERIEQHLKSMSMPPTGFVPRSLPVFQLEAKKEQMIPSYGFVPMWHYLPPSTQDTSQDHQLRPPAA